MNAICSLFVTEQLMLGRFLIFDNHIWDRLAYNALEDSERNVFDSWARITAHGGRPSTGVRWLPADFVLDFLECASIGAEPSTPRTVRARVLRHKLSSQHYAFAFGPPAVVE